MTKLKILLSNKFYYPKAGDCVYSLELEKLLRKNGHEVAFFAMQHSSNLPSQYAAYFPSTVDYSKRNFVNLKEQIVRPIHSAEVQNKFRRLLSDFKPDIVHVNNIHSQLSPLIVKEAYERGIPVIWTLHDYKLLCPRYDSLLNEKPCELCYSDKRNAVRNRCMKNSLSASLLAYMEAVIWSSRKLEQYTTAFVCPSDFIKQKMMKGGFSSQKLKVLNNFIDENRIANSAEQKERYYCYVGRLSKEKGVESLCEAAYQLREYKLYLLGTGPQEGYLKNRYASENIIFCGHQNWNTVRQIIAKAQFMVLPSICFENNPLSIIEAFTNGTPVLGANIGGIPELINSKEKGLLFHPGDTNDLKDKIHFFFNHLSKEMNYDRLIEDARRRFGSQKYYEGLLAIYQNSLSN